MKTDLVRLESVVEHGVGGPEAGAISLIYSILLQEYNFNIYNYIHINQIGTDLDEVIVVQGDNLYINIRYPIIEGFEQKTTNEKNSIRLDVIHSALIKAVNYQKKIDIRVLKKIRNKIEERNFKFEFLYKESYWKKDNTLVAKVLVEPQISVFKFYIQIIKNNENICRACIYNGMTNSFYFPDLFNTCKWDTQNTVTVSGIRSEIEIWVNVNECSVQYRNKNEVSNKAPIFELFKSEGDKGKALEEYIQSLNPSIAAILTQSQN
jgi:hypothetical protein